MMGQQWRQTLDQDGTDSGGLVGAEAETAKRTVQARGAGSKTHTQRKRTQSGFQLMERASERKTGERAPDPIPREKLVQGISECENQGEHNSILSQGWVRSK